MSLSRMHQTVLLPNSLTVEQQLMLIDMNERRRELNDDMDINIIKNWFPLTELNYSTIIGGFAWTSVVAKKKWILQSKAENFGAGWVSPSDVARDYLNTKYGKKRRRVTTAQYQATCTEKRSQPLLAIPGYMPDAVYIDLKSAYWSILKVVGWDVDYHPGRFMAVKSSVKDFPFPDFKLARNCLVSMGLPSPMRVWTGEKLTFVKKYNPLQNLVLWSCVQDVLHGIASEIEPYARYINTDGYIVEKKNAATVQQIIGSWGLDSDVRFSGEAHIYAAGQYNIGSKTWIEPRSRFLKEFRKIDTVPLAWLKKRFSNFSTRNV